jgi:hypothetical protein
VHEVAQWARAITQSLSLIRKTYRKIDPAAGHGLGGTGAVFSWSRRRVAKKTFRNDGRITGLKASGFNGRDVKPANGMVGGLLPRFAVQEGTPHSINRWLNVNGPGRHPLFAELTKATDAEGESGDVQWNFEKFLVAPDGEVVRRFRPRTEPDAKGVVEAIEAILPR